MRFTADSRRLYVACEQDNVVSLVDVAERKLIKSMPTGGERPVDIAISPDGKRIYVSHGRSEDVRVFEADTWKLLASILVGARLVDSTHTGEPISLRDGWACQRGGYRQYPNKPGGRAHQSRRTPLGRRHRGNQIRNPYGASDHHRLSGHEGPRRGAANDRIISRNDAKASRKEGTMIPELGGLSTFDFAEE
jgi:YVTN family beta-propeller protein